MSRKFFLVSLLIGALILASCSENSGKHEDYSRGYLSAVYELMPLTLQKLMDRDDFTDNLISVGIQPAPTEESGDEPFPTSLDDYLRKERVEAEGEQTLKIASFNIQVFGKSKMGKEDVVLNLLKILENFDLIAVQEIRDKSGEAIELLMDRLGRDKWGLAISTALGRTISKEQYAFLYRKDKFNLIFCEGWPDPKDLLHREPYLCTFEAGNFELTLINIHTDPDIVEQEINVLDDIYNEYSPRYEHLVLMGDLNAAPVDFDDLTRIPDVRWGIDQREKTNTRGTKNYDNIIYNYKKLDEFSKAYVFDMQSELGLSLRDALRVSDHNPVVIELIVPAGKRAA